MRRGGSLKREGGARKGAGDGFGSSVRERTEVVGGLSDTLDRAPIAAMERPARSGLVGETRDRLGLPRQTRRPSACDLGSQGGSGPGRRNTRRGLASISIDGLEAPEFGKASPPFDRSWRCLPANRGATPRGSVRPRGAASRNTTRIGNQPASTNALHVRFGTSDCGSAEARPRSPFAVPRRTLAGYASTGRSQSRLRLVQPSAISRACCLAGAANRHRECVLVPVGWCRGSRGDPVATSAGATRSSRPSHRAGLRPPHNARRAHRPRGNDARWLAVRPCRVRG